MAHYPASLAGCSLAYQARLLRVEPAAYVLRTVLSAWFWQYHICHHSEEADV